MVKGGLIQMSLKGSTEDAPDKIAKAMLDAQVVLIEKAGQEGVQVLSFQEVFTQPYCCPSQDAKWYAAAEAIPRRCDRQADAGLRQEIRDGHRRTDLRGSLRPYRGDRQQRPGRTTHPPDGLRHDPRGPQHIAVLPQPPAGNLRSAH